MSGYDPFGKENSRFVLKGSACQVSRAFYLYLIRYIHDTVSDSQCRRQYDFIRQMLRIIQAVKKHFHCHFSHDFQMCGDTGQRWLGQDRQRCVIETDDRYILRNAKSDFTQVADSGDRRFFYYRQGELSGYDLFVPAICGSEQNRLWQKGRYQ